MRSSTFAMRQDFVSDRDPLVIKVRLIMSRVFFSQCTLTVCIKIQELGTVQFVRVPGTCVYSTCVCTRLQVKSLCVNYEYSIQYSKASKQKIGNTSTTSKQNGPNNCQRPYILHYGQNS